jgi:hypothetical protein
MYMRTAVTLVLSLCLLVSITACQQRSRGDQPTHSSPEVSRGQDTEPGWSVGWSQLKAEVDAVEVLSLLGEPKHIKVNKVNTTWYYSDRGAEGPYVVFDTRRMRVDRWRAPRGR